MPLQNRVTPWGQIIATEEQGTMMGNRGILHRNKQIFRNSAYPGWITCQLEFNNNHRIVMSENRYTELFFLDEATAYSAGHRPCFECQRKRFWSFRKCWEETNSSLYNLINPTMPQIDRVIHKERINKEGKVTYPERASNVANGAFLEFEGKAYLKWDHLYLEWSPGGYVATIKISKKMLVRVLTPKSIVRCFDNGFVPKVHDSAL